MLQNILENFTYHEKWDVGVLYFLLLTLVLYLVFFPSSPTHKKSKTFLFVFGLIIYFLALGSPLNLMGRIKFRVHVIQMVMLFFLSAPLLVLGIKAEFFKLAVSVPLLKSTFRKLMNPYGTFIVFHVLFLSYHVPFIFDYVRISLFLNYFYLLAMFIVSLLFWLAIFPPIKELNQLTSQKRRNFYIGFIVFFVPLSVILVSSKQSFYSIYTDSELILSSLGLCLPVDQVDVPIIEKDIVEALLPFPPKREQVIGGIILLVAQLIFLIIFPFLKNYLHLQKKT